jgi:transketolase
MLNERSKQVRRDTIKLSKANGGYHFGGSFSCVEILIALFDHVMDLQDGNDKFIMSKGHACYPYYVLLKEEGFNPRLEGHPKRDPANGVECTTGSMGHGLPTAVGIAMAKKIKGEAGKVYVLMGDGECQEGTTWESLLIASQHQLDNLVIIVDHNKIQGSGRVNEVLSVEVLDNVVHHLGMDCNYVDGHNMEELVEVLSKEMQVGDVNFVLADTIKGKGVSFMEDKPEWHAKWLGDEDEAKAMAELGSN